MGNALDFLENRDKRKRKHRSECQEKIKKHIEEKGVTVCEDYMLVKDFTSTSQKVNEHFVYTGSISSLKTRLWKKKEPVPCEACKNDFTPTRRSRPPTKRERDMGVGDIHIWCQACRFKGKEYRVAMKKVGGYKKYKSLLNALLDYDNVCASENLTVLLPELEKRDFVNKSSKRLEKRILLIIDRAYSENEQRNIQMASKIHHYDFDF